MSFAITAAVVGVAGTAYSVYAGEKAAGQARGAARQQAKTERAVTAERISQLKREEMLMREQTIANTAASGLKISSASPLEILAEQKAQFERERAITQRVGASAVKASLQQGRIVAQQYQAQGIAGGLAGLQNTFNILSQRFPTPKPPASGGYSTTGGPT